MSTKRTTVWERKSPYVRKAGSPAAERIRARLRPSAITRITDRIVDWYEALDARLSAYEERENQRSKDFWITISAFSVLFVVFVAIGQPDKAPQFFATAAVFAFSARAYRNWHKQHPLPSPDRRRRRDSSVAMLHSVVAMLATFSAQWIVAASFEDPHLQLLPTAFASMAAGLGLYRLRTAEERKEQPRSHLDDVAGLLLMIGIVALFMLFD